MIKIIILFPVNQRTNNTCEALYRKLLSKKSIMGSSVRNLIFQLNKYFLFVGENPTVFLYCH